MSACPTEETLAELIEQRLPAGAAAAVHKHVRGCGNCRAILAGLADSSGEEAPPPALALGAITTGTPGSQSVTRDFGLRDLSRNEVRKASGAYDSNPASFRFDLGARVGRFEIERLIGLGGMGAVYAARDPELGRTVALKLLRVGRSQGQDSTARRSRLLREAQAMARLAHPNVVTVFQVGEFDDRLFVVMELVDGGNLTQWLRDAEKPRTLDEILDIFVAAGRGLAAAHAAGIVHRDFKPDNVLVGNDGRVRVTDFGLARPVIDDQAILTPPDAKITGELSPDDSLTPMGALVGTPAYMAPEQLGGHPIDARADLFSFCTSLYEALYGKRPFSGTTLFELRRKIEKAELEPIPAGARNVPGWLRRELLRGLHVDPAQRPRSINELLETIRRCRAQWQRRRTWLKAAAAAFVIAALAGVALWRWPARSAQATGVHARRAVAVIGPRNLSGRAEAAWLSAALGEMLGTEVGADGTLRLLGADQVARTLDDLGVPAAAALPADALKKLRLLMGADAVVSGSYLAAGGGQLRLDLRVWDADTGEAMASVAESGEERRLFELVSRAGVQVRRALGGDPLTLAHAAQASFPAHPEAARLYAAGVSQLRAFDYAAALESLTRAAELAPDNPRVQGALSDAYLVLGRTQEAREAARKAFESSGGLGRDERLRVELTFRHATRDFARAIDIAQALFTFFPDDVSSGVKLADEQIAANLGRDALETVATLRKLPAPTNQDLRIDLTESEAASQVGEQQRAIDAAKRAEAAARARGSRFLLAKALYVGAEAARLKGDLATAKQGFRGAQELYLTVKDRWGYAKATTMGATVLADEGDLQGAAGQLTTAAATFQELGNLRSAAANEHNLAIVQRRLRDLPKALEHIQHARELVSRINEPASMASALIVLGHVKQDLGDLAGAAEAMAEALALRTQIKHRQIGNALACVAELKLLRGDLDGARALYVEVEKVTRPDDKPQLGQARSGEGRLLLAEGKLAQAADKLREAAKLQTEASKRDEAALDESYLARALLLLGQTAEAGKAIERAGQQLGQTKSLLARRSVEIVAARVRAALHPDERAAAVRELETLRAEAVRHGVVEEQLAARLALLQLGPDDEAAAGYRKFAADARTLGYELLAREADAATGRK